MRRILLLLGATLVLATPVALAGVVYPETIALPDGWQPEGIATGRGDTFYVGSRTTGEVYTGSLRTGVGRVLVDVEGLAATGLKFDRGRLWVSGAATGKAFVYDARTGALIREYQLATGPELTFINDVVVTRSAAYFTDSRRPVLYRVATSRNGVPGAVTTLQLSGAFHLVPGEFNLNGIAATPDGKTLIAVQSVNGMLFTIDPGTGATKAIDLGGKTLVNGDGILLQGRTLYVVQNRDNKIAVVRLTPDLIRGTVAPTALTDPDFDVPSTIARAGSRLYVVNARFGSTTGDPAKDVVKVGG